MNIKDILRKATGRVLYYPGCLTKNVLTTELSNYNEILNKLGVDFIMIPEENCCALPVLNAGHKKSANEIAKKNHELFKKKRVIKIITSCPSCYHMFNSYYPSVLKDWDIEVEHTTQTILKALKKKKIRSSSEEKQIVTYHDPCHLARYEKDFESPREVIRLLDSEIKEADKSKEEAICCGGGGGVRSNYPKLAKDMAKLRISHFPPEAKRIITPCGMCYSNLKQHDDRVTEFSSYVLGRLRKKGY